MSGHRKIIHLDMDAFFAAVEQRDFPQYRGKPIVVGGAPDSRGVVATCSYEARQFGIHSAMPSAQAYRLCPRAIFVKPRFDAYREASATIRAIFNQYTDLVEPLSLDEAFLDVSGTEICKGSATFIAKDIKNKIKQETALTASAGISYNKFLAKIASDLDKPDGLYLITPGQGPTFVERLEVGKFHGIGRATQAKMNAMGIYSGDDLKKCSLQMLQRHFGKAGSHYYNIARGIDERPVRTSRPSKSIGAETTFARDLIVRQEIMEQLHSLFAKALARVNAKHLQARTVTVKIKYQNFEQITRSKTTRGPIRDAATDFEVINDLLVKTEIGRRKVRLLGVTFSSLEAKSMDGACRQLDLFKPFQS